jgi:hypothetical protein
LEGGYGECPGKELKRPYDLKRMSASSIMKEEGFRELAKILPIEKQARYIVFQTEFRREMHRLMQKARHREGRPQSPEAACFTTPAR